MTCVTYEEFAPFWRRAEPFLLEREAEHNLLLGLGGQIAAGQYAALEHAIFKAVAQDDAGEARGVALAIPPNNLVLSLMPEDALPELAEMLGEFWPYARGVLGPNALSRRFAAEWSRQRGIPARQALSERIYRLERVTPPTGVPGALRRADARDRPTLLEWTAAFAREAHVLEPSPTDLARNVDAILTTAARQRYLWIVDETPVAMVGFSGPTANGMRVGPVYTPLALRGHGYASAATAAASALILASGKRCCFLFTDLANPTSNKIYQAIGYVPVCDVLEYRFD